MGSVGQCPKPTGTHICTILWTGGEERDTDHAKRIVKWSRGSESEGAWGVGRGSIYVEKGGFVPTEAAHILKLEQYRED